MIAIGRSLANPAVRIMKYPVALLDTCQRMNLEGLGVLEAEKTPLTDPRRFATGSKSKPPPGALRTADAGRCSRNVTDPDAAEVLA